MVQYYFVTLLSCLSFFIVYFFSSIYLVTYNVAGKHPDECLNDLLSLEEGNEEKLPDLYIVGLQEVKSQIHNIVLDALFDDPWTGAFK